MTLLREKPKTLGLMLNQAVSFIDTDGVIQSLADDLTIMLSKLEPKPDQLQMNAALALALHRVFGYDRFAREFLSHVAEAVSNSVLMKESKLSQAETDEIKVRAAGVSPTFAELLVSGTEDEIELAVRIYVAVQDLEKQIREKGGNSGFLRLDGQTKIPHERAAELAEKLTKEFTRHASVRTVPA